MSSSKTIALVGNPNCGKTTLFNMLTGSRQRTGNWPGVTVEKKEGEFSHDNNSVLVVDLPGIYSLSAYSEDEEVARNYILSSEADLVVNLVDASNIERNLYLTTHLIEMGVPLMVVLTMKDMAHAREIKVKKDQLSKMLGIPVEYITTTTKSDIEQLKGEIVKCVASPKTSTVQIAYDNEIEESLTEMNKVLEPISRETKMPLRWLGVKLLEGDPQLQARVERLGVEKGFVEAQQSKIEKTIDDEADIVIADARYGLIHGLVKKAVIKGNPQRSITDKIDSVVLNRFLGIPIFMAVMYLVFWATINLGGSFIDFFDIFAGTVFVDAPTELLNNLGAPQWLIAILATGIGGGIQTVATFVPIIFMLYFIMSMLEDSGYMARGAFVMDRLMRFIGLPGKAFIPMMVGFGCTVPAIMATRTLESKRDRLLTIFMAPFMSCGARLPVYALFAAAFFPNSGQNVVFLLYVIGIVLAIATGLLLKKSVFVGEAAPFVMELPPYHAPRIKHIFIHTWEKLKGFIIKAGKVLLVIVTVLGVMNSMGTDGTFGNEDSEESVLAAAGKAVTPLFRPFGIQEENWPASVGLFTGLFAKEVVVGTLNSLYAAAAEDDGGEDEPFEFWAGISEAFASIPANLADLVSFDGLKDPLGMNIGDVSDEGTVSEDLEVDSKIFSEMRARFIGGPMAAFAYLLFILLYVPCLVAVAAAIKEMGWKLSIFQATYSTMLAWVVATLFYQITVERNVGYIIAAIVVLVVSIAAIFGWSKRGLAKD